jgi:hypothetical protein
MSPLFFIAPIIAGILSSFFFLALLVTPICFFMMRNDEKRSGISTFSGKSAILFTLINKTAWIAFIGLTMILLTFVLPESSRWDPETGERIETGTDFTTLRIGFVLMLVGIASTFFLFTIWNRWSQQQVALPSSNMFVKCYSGLNVFFLLASVLGLVTLLAIAIMELMFGDAEWRMVKEPFKIGVVLLISCVVFLVCNLRIYSKSSDAVVPFVKSPETNET